MADTYHVDDSAHGASEAEVAVGAAVAAWYRSSVDPARTAGERARAVLAEVSSHSKGRDRVPRSWSDHVRAMGFVRWLGRRRPLALSPLGVGLAAAACIAAGVIVGRGTSGVHGGIVPLPVPVPKPVPLRAATVAPTVALRTVRFVFVTPLGPSRVALVGDFNGWDVTAAPLRPLSVAAARSVARANRSPSEITWVADVPLLPGRHAYAFVVDGLHWVPDPGTARAPDDGYGAQTSIIVVGADGAA